MTSGSHDERVAARRGWRRWAVAAALVLAVVAMIWRGNRPTDQPTVDQPSVERLKTFVPRQVIGEEFASSSACRECHPREHGSWSKTYHRTMTQLALPETVLAPFRDVELTSRGRWYRLNQQDDSFWVTMRDPDWEAGQLAMGLEPDRVPNPPTITKPIVMTTGSHHMQGYWFPRGQGTELLQLPFYYHLGDQRWIPREDVFLRPPDKDENLANWSMVCIKCHSVAGIPGGDPTQTFMNSQVAELGIACEACHGPGAEHVRLQREVAKRGGPTPPHDPIVNPSRTSSKTQSEICGQCHSEFFPSNPLEFWTSGIGYRAGRDFEQTHAVIRFDGPIYRDFKEKFQYTFWNDGTCRVGGDEFNAHIASPCYERGKLSCLSCHSMHEAEPNDLLAAGMQGNHACQQCHDQPRFNENLAEHTHHAPASNGSLCYNCHMPHTSYALMTALRSHRITNPQVASIVGGGSPNACNLCHVDRTLGWTSKHLSDWYDQPPVTLRDDETRVAASLLWLLRGDAMQRAIAAWHLGWQPAQEVSGNRWQAPFLSRVLEDPYAGVRYQAIKSLQSLPGFNGFEVDFIGTAAEWKAAQQRVDSAWRQGDRTLPAGGLKEILLSDDFTVLQETVERLLNQRDDRYVRIPE